jgi:hypothetical protein
MGLQGLGRQTKAEIIRHIQRAELNTPCFGSEQAADCPYPDCCWRSDCLKA